MSQFSVAPTASPKFDGEFQLTPAQGYTPTGPEADYIAALVKTLDVLAQDQDRDAENDIPDTLRADRRAARKTIATALMADATKFANGSLTPADAAASASALDARYKTTVPKFGVRNKIPASFEGEFEVVPAPNHQVPDAEAGYLAALQSFFRELGGDEKADPTIGLSPASIEARKALRKTTIDRLNSHASDFCQGKISPAVANEKVLIAKGAYRALRERLKQKLFSAAVIDRKSGVKTADDLAVDLRIGMRGGLPAPEDTPSPEKEALFVEINKANTVIRTVCQRMMEKPTPWWRTKDSQAQETEATKKEAEAANNLRIERALRVQDEYIVKLKGIAMVGLEDRQTALAKLALKELKAEFAARVGTRIKSKYARWLALWSGLAALLLMFVYVVVRVKHPDWIWAQQHTPFLLAGVGAAIGAWLSFSIREVEFVFEDLLLLEDDPADPPLRIAFVIVLTWTAFLLFWTGAINIEIGALQTKPAALQIAGTIALLVGIFCGLSERALATAISGRAGSFVKGVAGGT